MGKDNYWNTIVMMLVLLYIVHITARGELKTYIQFFFQTEPKDTGGIGPNAQGPAVGQGQTLSKEGVNAVLSQKPGILGGLLGGFSGLPSTGYFGGGPPV